MAVDSDLVWIRTERKVRARLNAWRALVGLSANGTLDQTATIDKLLDAVGAPSAEDVQAAPTSAAVRE